MTFPKCHRSMVSSGSRSRVNSRRRRWLLGLLRTVAFLCLLQMMWFSGQVSFAAVGQNPPLTSAASQGLSSYEGQNVSSVQIAGHPELSPEHFEPIFVQHRGEPFSRDKVKQTASALKTNGKFKEVRIQVEPESDGVRVIFIPEPAVYFGIFQFPGSGPFPYSRLVQVANYSSETPFNSSEIDKARQDLIRFFQQEGFFLADVTPEVESDKGQAVANVIFHITLARRAKFGRIKIDGPPPKDAGHLQDSLTTLLARARTAAIRSGKAYHHSTLTKATQYLQAELEKQGHLGAVVKLAGAEYHADTNRADIHFTVNPGLTTHVQIEGAHLWSWTRKSLLPIYQGVGVDDEAVQEGQQALLSYFQGKGFFDVKVDSRVTTEKTGAMVIYSIQKEKKHKVEDVSMSGNISLPESHLRPHIAVEREHFLSSGKFSEQLLRSSAKNLKATYQSEGFSSVQVTPAVARRDGDIRVSFNVTEGPRDIVNSLAVEGAETFPESQFAPGGLELAKGQPYSLAHVEADRAKILSHYLQAGYLISSFHETATPVSKTDPHHIKVVYHILEGPKVYTGSVLTLGREQTRQRTINLDIASIKAGQPLTETQLLTAGSKLYDHVGVFDWAEVDPKRQITTQDQEDVLVKLHEAKRNSFTYGFGFEVINRGGSLPGGTVGLPNLPPVGLPQNFTVSQTTFYGPRGTAQYTRNNLRGKDESFSVTAFAGRLDQRGAAYYIDPTFRWSPWKTTTSLSFERNEQNPIFSSDQGLGSFQLQRALDKAKNSTLFLRYSFSRTALTRIEIPALVPAEDQRVRLSTLAANITRDTRDNVLDEHRGVLQSIELDFNSSKLGSSVDFVKLNGQAAYYKQAFHHVVWANSLRVGLSQPFANSRVPLSERFFTGGADSLRGFPLDGAGPQRQVQACSSGSSTNCTLLKVPAGGNELLLINSEARIPLPFKKGLSIVPFYDGGNAFPIVGFHDFTSLYSNNVGLGLRYSTPVGPIRFDLGRNLNPIPGVQATQYFISIGQAF